MAGEWIKFRNALPDDPRVVRMAEYLRRIGSDSDDVNANTSMRVTLCVTVVALLRVWCMADEVGQVDGNDVVIPNTSARDVTHFVSLRGFDDAMKLVDWIRDEASGVRFPKLLRYNTIRSSSSVSAADRQRAYRERKKAADAVADNPGERYENRNVTRCATSNVTLSSPLISSAVVGGIQDGGTGGKPDPDQVAWFKRRPDWVPEGKPWLDREACERLASLGLTTEQVREVMRDAKDRRNVLKNPAGFVLKKLCGIGGGQGTPKPQNAAVSI